MARTTTQAVEIVRAIVGRRHRITRAEMREILVRLAGAGLDLRNTHVRDTVPVIDWQPGWTIAEHQAAQLAEIAADETWHARQAEAWTRVCCGIECVSLSMGGLRDGYVRYDEPGRMRPGQHADLTFAPSTLGDYDYLHQHADLVLIVEEQA